MAPRGYPSDNDVTLSSEHDKPRLVITITKKSRADQIDLLSKKEHANMWEKAKDENLEPESPRFGQYPK